MAAVALILYMSVYKYSTPLARGGVVDGRGDLAPTIDLRNLAR